MTQVDRWIAKYKDMMDFMEKSHRNLSRCRIEEHDKLNWHFDAIHLSDISIVEELLYAMILKDLK